MAFDLDSALAERRARHQYRQRLTLSGGSGREARLAGRRLINFASNDYLGLAGHPDVVAAMQEASARYGVGSGASHLVTGHTDLHEALEEALAAFTGRPRALLFSTGYMANQGILTALLDKQDAVFEDRLNHASLLDGGLASGARFRRYLHNQPDNLASKLAGSPARRKLVVTDGVFSMDGDSAPLAALCDVAEAQDAWVMVDDAHGFGVLGEGGRGSVHAQGVNARVPVYMATLGKAAGTFGAFVAGSEALIETLIQFARPYVYTTALPPALAAATLASLDIIAAADDRRQHLAQLVQDFRQQATAQGWQLLPSQTPIQPLLVGSEADALALAQRLREQGLLVPAIRPPTVPTGEARLRITFSAAHTQDDLGQLLDALALARRTLNPGDQDR
ncbi:MAG: 8-amino-7-oxononanoate synthase [Alcanivoracaceae bacterium]